MVTYYAAKRQLLSYIETTLMEEGEISYAKLYFMSQRNWGFGSKLVDSIIDTMVEARRARKGVLGVERYNEVARQIIEATKEPKMVLPFAEANAPAFRKKKVKA